MLDYRDVCDVCVCVIVETLFVKCCDCRVCWICVIVECVLCARCDCRDVGL